MISVSTPLGNISNIGYNNMSVMGEPSVAAWAAQRIGNNISLVDRVPADVLHLVHHYWYQFPPMNSLWDGILGFVMGLLSVVSILGNGMVIYIFSSTKALRTPSNFLVLNLALSDFLMMSTNAVPMVINCYYETWVLGPTFCELYAMTASLYGFVSIWSMTFIAMDRYNVIVHGLSAKPLTKRGVLVRILLTWVIAACWSSAPMFGWNKYILEGNMTACGTDYFTTTWLNRSYIMVYSGIAYFTPLNIIIYSYWFIVQAVAAHEKSMREQAKKMNVTSLRSSDAAQKSTEFKLAKVALMTTALWFFAWTPYLVTNYVGIFEAARISPLSSIWCSLFAKTSAVYNPIVYGISHPKYRQALQRKFPALVCAEKPEGDSTSQTSVATNVNVAEEPAA
uniref:Long wavelength sensitive opsin 2 n=1 Tax=Trichodes sinae TaxID=1850556 RepID=A0A8F2P3F4_9CUCU|nr:long wavelength sensitive opsin 2 [Trichodes sinae]